MKLKRLILLIISFVAFLGLGMILSRQQSQRADQVLNNNGLSSTYYVFKSKKKHNIKQLLNYVNKNFAHDKVQIHFESDYIPDRVLIWANYNKRVNHWPKEARVTLLKATLMDQFLLQLFQRIPKVKL